MNYAELHQRGTLIIEEKPCSVRARRNQALIAGLSREDALKVIVADMRERYAFYGGYHVMGNGK